MSRAMRIWNSFWYGPGSAHNLAAARIIIATHGLWLLLSRDIPGVSSLPPAFWTTTSSLARWRYLVFPGHPAMEYAFQGLTVLALGCVILGLFPRLSCLTSALLLYHFGGLETIFWTIEPGTRGFSITILSLIVLGCSPCADVWRARPTRLPVNQPAGGYTWPLKLIQLFVVQVYFFSAWAKLWLGGFGWFSAANMHGFILLSNDSVPIVFHRMGDFMLAHPTLMFLLAVATTGMEIVFPVVLISRFARYLLIPSALLMHVGILFVLNIAFPGVPRLLIFVNWDWVRTHLRPPHRLRRPNLLPTR